MAKKKKATQLQAWCWYCDREFEDEKVLLLHQKAKHYRCPQCPRRLNTAGGLAVHLTQVHKAEPDRLENTLPGRDTFDVEIYGMEGIPEKDLQEWMARKASGDGGNDQRPSKKAKVENVPLTPEELKAQLAAHKAMMSGQATPAAPPAGPSPLPAGPGGLYGVPPPGFAYPPAALQFNRPNSFPVPPPPFPHGPPPSFPNAPPPFGRPPPNIPPPGFRPGGFPGGPPPMAVPPPGFNPGSPYPPPPPGHVYPVYGGVNDAPQATQAPPAQQISPHQVAIRSGAKSRLVYVDSVLSPEEKLARTFKYSFADPEDGATGKENANPISYNDGRPADASVIPGAAGAVAATRGWEDRVLPKGSHPDANPSGTEPASVEGDTVVAIDSAITSVQGSTDTDANFERNKTVSVAEEEDTKPQKGNSDSQAGSQVGKVARKIKASDLF